MTAAPATQEAGEQGLTAARCTGLFGREIIGSDQLLKLLKAFPIDVAFLVVRNERKPVLARLATMALLGNPVVVGGDLLAYCSF